MCVFLWSVCLGCRKKAVYLQKQTEGHEQTIDDLQGKCWQRKDIHVGGGIHTFVAEQSTKLQAHSGSNLHEQGYRGDEDEDFGTTLRHQPWAEKFG